MSIPSKSKFTDLGLAHDCCQAKYKETPPSQRVLIAVSGIPGSGMRTGLASAA